MSRHIRPQAIWVLHDPQPAASAPHIQDAQRSVGVVLTDPPTLRLMKAARVIEFRPESPTPWVLVDVEKAGRPSLARCKSLGEAQQAAKAEGAK